MFTQNAVGQISAGLLALNQRLKEDVLGHAAVDGEVDADVIEGMVKIQNTAAELFDELQSKEDAVAVSKLLSATGQQQKMIEIVVDIRARLGFVDRAAKDRREVAAAERKILESTPAPSGDPVVAKLEEIQILARLRSLSMAGRMLVYATAKAKGETAIERAIKNTQAYEVLIEPEFLKRVDHEALEKLQPERLRRITTLEFVADKLTLLASAIEATLGSYGHIVNFPTPPIKQIDLGTRDSQAAPAKSLADRPPVGGLRQ